MNDEILVPLDLSDAIAMIDRQKKQITTLTAERDRLWSNINITEAALGISGIYATKDKQIVNLEKTVKEKSATIQESCVIIAKGLKVVEGLEGQIASLTAENDRLREILEAPRRNCDPLRIING